MSARQLSRWGAVTVMAAMGLVWTAGGSAQQRSNPLDAGPWLFDTHEDETRIRVSIVARPLSHPWGLAFLPNGDLLITERDGRLRLVRDGKLLPESVADMPDVSSAPLAGLLDIALHPRFEENAQVYFTYSKPLGEVVATALARGRWTGERLVDIQDVFVADDFGERRAGAQGPGIGAAIRGHVARHGLRDEIEGGAVGIGELRGLQEQVRRLRIARAERRQREMVQQPEHLRPVFQRVMLAGEQERCLGVGARNGK